MGKKSNKKFAQFLKINEMCVKRKLKSFLEEPAVRIMQYLQLLTIIYARYKTESDRQSEKQMLLIQSIMDIKKVTDEIAIKCRDNKSRQMVGKLQMDLFGNKIQLLAAHRFCIRYSSMKLLLNTNKEKKLKSYQFVLCNDIFLIATSSNKFKSGQLVAVHPLIGLRVSKNVTVHDPKLVETVNSEQHKFCLLPSNIIIFGENADKMEEWIKLIEDAVDEQEHSLKICNVVDLEKRLRKQKTSKEGESETINITNKEKIKQIELWRKKKYKINEDDVKSENVTSLKPNSPTKPRSVSSITTSPRAKPNKPAIVRLKSEPNTEPKTTEPPRQKPNISRRKTVDSVALQKEEQKKDNLETVKEENDSKKNEEENTSKEMVLEKKKSNRMNLMSGITGFNKQKTLKRIDTETLQKAEPETVNNLLQSTLKNYRQFVMDDDSESDQSENDWSD